MPYISNERLWLNSDRSKVVKDGDPDAAYLLVSAGGMLDDVTAGQYGLGGKRPSADGTDPGAAADGEKAAQPARATKIRRAAAENKAESVDAQASADMGLPAPTEE